MNPTIRLLDVVAVTEDLPGKGLARGQVGTVIEELAPDVYEVEFCDDEGRTYRASVLARQPTLGPSLPTDCGCLMHSGPDPFLLAPFLCPSLA